jgi:hypothetical protein
MSARRSDPPPTRPGPAVATRLLLWWAAGFGVYLLLIPTITHAELVAGLVLGLAVALVGAAASRAIGPPWRARLHWPSLWWLPVDLARDTWTVVAFLARYVASGGRASGHFDEVVLAAAEEREQGAVRAYAALLLSVPPGGYVVDVEVREEAADRVSVHRLGTPGRSGAVVDR